METHAIRIVERKQLDELSLSEQSAHAHRQVQRSVNIGELKKIERGIAKSGKPLNEHRNEIDDWCKMMKFNLGEPEIHTEPRVVAPVDLVKAHALKLVGPNGSNTLPSEEKLRQALIAAAKKA